MKRRGFLKGLFGTAVAAPAIVKGFSKPEDKTIGKKIKLTEPGIYKYNLPPMPEKGMVRAKPLEAIGYSSSDMLLGNEVTPRLEMWDGKRWKDV